MLRSVYEQAQVVFSGRYYTTINELTDQVPALRPQVLWRAALEVARLGDFNADKVLCEEDKGAPLGTVVSLVTGLPLAIARWYPYAMPVGIKVPIDSEYFVGDLYVNGIEAGDRVTIVDDTISSGGTLISLIEAVRRAGAEVHDAVALVEKVDNGGVAKVAQATGVRIKTGMRIRIIDRRVIVL